MLTEMENSARLTPLGGSISTIMTEEKFNWVIVNPDWSETSNGILMLFRLCHYLNEFGENACMLANNDKILEEPGNGLNVGLPITRREFEAMDPAKTVVVYPEMVYGNPLDAKIVVRWILNRPGVCGGDGKYDADDFIFIYSDYFKPEGCVVDGKLTIYNPYFENFADDGLPREGTCYMVRKGWQKPLVHHPKDALLIDNYGDRGGNDYLRHCFNRFEKFITYDHATLACVQAALCGCLSIVIPDGVTTAQEWRLVNPMAAYGVAYGFDDVNWATLTRPLLREHLRLLEKSSVAEIKNFIQVVKRGRKPRSAPIANGQIVSKMGSTEAVQAKVEVDGDPLWVQFIASKETFEFGYRAAAGVFLRREYVIKLYYMSGRLVKIRLAVSRGKITGPLSLSLGKRPGFIYLKKLEVQDSNGALVASFLGDNIKTLHVQGTAFFLEPRRGEQRRTNNTILVSTGNNPILLLPDVPEIRERDTEILIEFIHSEDMSDLKLEFEVSAAVWKLINSSRKSKKISFHRFLMLMLILQARGFMVLGRFIYHKQKKSRSGHLGFFRKLERSFRRRRKEWMAIRRAKSKK